MQVVQRTPMQSKTAGSIIATIAIFAPAILFGGFLSSLDDRDVTGTHLAILLALSAAAIVLLVAVVFGVWRRSMFEVFPWFVALSGAYLLVRPWTMLAIDGLGTNHYVGFAGVDVSAGTIATSITVGMCSTLAFSIGYLLDWSRRLSRKLDGFRFPQLTSKAAFAVLLSLGLMGGLIGRLLLISSKGGLMEFQQTRGVDNAGLGPLWYLAGLTVSMSLMYVWAVTSGYAKRRWWLDLIVMAGMPSILFINSRGGFLSFAMAALFLRWRNKGSASVYPLMIATAMLVIAWGPARGLVVDGALNLDTPMFQLENDEDLDRLTGATLSLGVTDMYWLVVGNTPGTANYQYGKLAIASFLDLVPRAVWTSKTLTGSNYFMEAFFPDMAGTNTVVPGYFGILYLEGGMPWLVLLSLAFGIGSRACFVATQSCERNAMAPLVYAILFANIPNVMQSGLYSVAVSEVWALMPIVAITLTTHIASPPPKRALRRQMNSWQS